MKRLVILGSKSFIASSIIKYTSKNYKLILVDRKICNFEKSSCVKRLSNILKSGDTVIFIAAKAPVKNIEMFNENILICKNIFNALSKVKDIHLIYMSSDAVYGDRKGLISESSKVEPSSLHGLMHITREKMLKYLNCKKYTILRPTLIYGLQDPHNGYGPNKFYRSAKSKKIIYLFGRGEERRDHIYIEDIGKIISCIINKKKTGIFNLVSGKVISFFEIAKIISKLNKNNISVKFLKRIGSMPHNGFRAFNNAKLKKIYKKNIHSVKLGLLDMYCGKQQK